MVPDNPLEISTAHPVSPVIKRSKPIAIETPSIKTIKDLPDDVCLETE